MKKTVSEFSDFRISEFSFEKISEAAVIFLIWNFSTQNTREDMTETDDEKESYLRNVVLFGDFGTNRILLLLMSPSWWSSDLTNTQTDKVAGKHPSYEDGIAISSILTERQV